MTDLWRKDLMPALAFVVFAGWLLYEAVVLDVEVAGHVGGGMDAAGYPRTLALSIIFLSILIMGQSLWMGRARMRRAGDSGESPYSPGSEARALVKPSLAVLAIVLFTFALIPVGFLIATPALLAFFMYLVGERRWGWIVFGAIALTLATWAISFFGFHILLPEGWLGFLTD